MFRQKLHDGSFGASNSQSFRVLWVLCPRISRIIRIPLYKPKPRISPPLVSTWTWVQRMKALSTSARSRRWHRWHPTVVVNGWYRKIHGSYPQDSWVYGCHIWVRRFMDYNTLQKKRIRFWGPIQEGLKVETSNWVVFFEGVQPRSKSKWDWDHFLGCLLAFHSWMLAIPSRPVLI